MEWIKKATKEDMYLNEILSFDEYMEVFEKFPNRECRPSSKYLIDMLEYFGKDSDGGFKLFHTNHPDSSAVFGQRKTQQALYHNLINFEDEGINNKFILLVGPNGSSKSSLVKKLMKGAEEYSKTEEGVLYSFSWIFPVDKILKGSMGIAVEGQAENLNTYAKLDDKRISALLNSELKDHPLLLIPRKYRQELIDQKFSSDMRHLNNVKKTYLYQGDMSKRNKMVYDALLKNYKDDHQEVLKHIRVERFTISRRYSIGAATIEPQMHVDARMQQITMDKRLAGLPPSLQSINLFSLQGEVILANRGILEYSDLLKRPLDAYKYLLATTESGNVNLGGILTELDIVFVGTSNEIHLAAFKQHPDFNSFSARFDFVRVPYLLNYLDEKNIYKDQIEGLKEKSVFEPHALSILCMFSVMTRLRACQSKKYTEKKLSEITSSLNPLEKCLLYAKDETPERLSSEEKQILKQGLNEIKQEYENENLYEGKFGISPRDIKNIIYKLTSDHQNITMVEIIEYLEQFVQMRNHHDFLSITPQGDYHHPVRFLSFLKEYSLNIIDREMRNSLGLVDERSYEDHIKRYIENINALIKGEKIKNPITGKFIDCDQYFIKEFERNINLQEKEDSFRSHLISRLGAYYLDNPGQQITYHEVFPDLVKRLQESFHHEQKKVIKEISKNLVFFETEKKDEKKSISTLSKDDRKQIQSVLDNLTSQYGYSVKGAMSILKYIIKMRY